MVFPFYRMPCLVVALVAAGDPMAAEVADPAAGGEAELALEVFSAPKVRNMAAPRYPRRRARDFREGWVQLNFMVGRDGSPYEIAVTDSTGDAAFEEAAVAAVARSTFEPASLGGEPIDAGHALKIRFSLSEPLESARPSFVSRHRALMTAIYAGDRKAADRHLDALEVRNLYEDAYYHLARYFHASRWGQRAEQIQALKRTIAHEREGTYLPEALFVDALASLFSLQVDVQDFGGALETWGTLQSQGLEPQARRTLEQAVAGIRALQEDDRAFTVAGSVGTSASWHFRLLKRRFAIDVQEGYVAELKLRCDRQYLLFRYSPDIRYQIDPAHGACLLEVVGDPGTRFTLTQS